MVEEGWLRRGGRGEIEGRGMWGLSELVSHVI